MKINLEETLGNLKIQHLNKMQTSAIKSFNRHKELLLLAPTGSGKTIAYLLSLFSFVKSSKNGVQVLILAPSRELVIQIENVLKQMKLPLKVNSCYGGHEFSIERKNFSTPPSILIGTPGRILDHIQRRTFNPDTISQIVFDEFDKSLEMGFSSQMESISGQLKNIDRSILVSATQSIKIPEYLNLVHIHTLNFSEDSENRLKLFQIKVPKDEKPEGLFRILSMLDKNQNAIVFFNHREACERISSFLNFEGASYSIYHGGLKQEKRELQLTKFRNGSSQILIATDIAARGIDIPELDYVIHYQMPLDENAFIHRNGRTARMKSSGTSILIRTTEDPLPSYIDKKPEIFEANQNINFNKSEYLTLYINKGKKDKINKIDLVGFFLQFDFMSKEDLGLIEVKDYSAYVAIPFDKSKSLLAASKDKKIKNKVCKISIAK